MHTLLIVISLTLGLGGGVVCRQLLPRARSWESRRLIAGAGLLISVLPVGLLAGVMAHFVSQVCFLTAPPADVALASGLSVLGAGGLAAVLLMHGGRRSLAPWYLARRTWPAPAWLQARVGVLRVELGLRRSPVVRVLLDSRPWALVACARRPQLILSSGLVTLLDSEELDAVLCHELMHLQRGDLAWSAVAGVLRDLTWILPTSRALYRLLRAEQELACDDRVVGAARRVALASALARVWQVSAGASPSGTLALLAPGQVALFERRVRRLLDVPHPPVAGRPAWALVAGAGVVGLVLGLQGVAILWTMTQVGCDFMAMGPRVGGMG